MTLPSPMPPRRRLGQPIAELPLPLLGDLQQRAFDHFVEHDLPAIFQSAFPIALRGQSLECLQVTLGDPPDWDECQRQGSTYGRAIRCRIGLRRGETGTVELIDLGLLPVPRQGRFLIEGKERVLISELLRGRGVVFTPGPGCKIIPERGKTIRLVLQARSNPYIRARIGSSRRGVPAVTLLRALAPDGCSDEELRGWLDLETDKELKSGSLLANSFLANKARSREQAQVLVGSILLSSPATLADDEAIQQFTQVLGDPARYDLGQLRRQQLNRRFRHDPPEEGPLLGPRDLVAALRIFSRIYVGEENPDRNEDLAYCQVRTAAEQMRAALCSALDYARTRLARDFKKHKQGLQEMWARPRETIQKKLLSLFGQNALCEPVSQVNPLDHLTQLRRTSAFGRKGLPSGAAYRVQRDSHPSHVGRLCPVETPEGANIGLHNSLALYARCDGEGYLQAPAYPVHNGQILSDLVWLRPGEEGEKWLVCADAPRSAPDRLASGPHLARRGDTWAHVSVQEVGFVDACSRQMLGLSAGLIPFIEHDDAIRALMGSNMQRQALPLLRPEPPRVGTGLEREISRQSSLVVVAEKAGTVVEVDGQHLVIDDQRYDLDKYLPLSEGACQNQKPIVAKGSKVRAGQVIADGAATAQGELALGTNLLVALMVWEGYNFEDAIVVSERLVSEDVLTSLHVEEFVVEARMFPGGGEERISTSLLDLSQPRCRWLVLDDCLDEGLVPGVARIGSRVHPGDVLVSKVSPPARDLTPEERVQKALGLSLERDTCFRVPPGIDGIVTRVESFVSEEEKPADGVLQRVRVTVVCPRQLEVGDKIVGRHGNKGVVAKILPVEDMPFLADGTPVDVVLNPLGVPSRMNLGQVFEALLGWAAQKRGYWAEVAPFAHMDEKEIGQCLRAAQLPEEGAVDLYDGRTGERFDQKVLVGVMYLMKLKHQAVKGLHARATGRYDLVTQQPVTGRLRHGGQRFGEMEVWALEACGAAHALQELLTVKSDDVSGRREVYQAILHDRDDWPIGTPAAWEVLRAELRALGLELDELQGEDQGDSPP